MTCCLTDWVRQAMEITGKKCYCSVLPFLWTAFTSSQIYSGFVIHWEAVLVIFGAVSCFLLCSLTVQTGFPLEWIWFKWLRDVSNVDNVEHFTSKPRQQGHCRNASAPVQTCKQHTPQMLYCDPWISNWLLSILINQDFSPLCHLRLFKKIYIYFLNVDILSCFWHNPDLHFLCPLCNNIQGDPLIL